MEKVWIQLPEGWHGHEKEGIWCEIIEHDRYRVRNTPFFAFGLSLNDEIAAQFDTTENLFTFRKIIRKAGHSTYRCMVGPERSEKLPEYISRLNKLGCWYESAEIGELELLAFDIPPSVDVHDAYKILDAGANESVWDFEEADYYKS